MNNMKDFTAMEITLKLAKYWKGIQCLYGNFKRIDKHKIRVLKYSVRKQKTLSEKRFCYTETF